MHQQLRSVKAATLRFAAQPDSYNDGSAATSAANRLI